MTTDVSIANEALTILGADTIQNLNDDLKNARAINAVFEQVRQSELRAHRWRFSITRKSIAALSSTPDSDYSYEYQVPNGFLRLIEGGDIVSVVDLSDFVYGAGQALYSLEGRRILTNLSSPLAIRYIQDVTDASQFDACFARVFAAELAYTTCYRITNGTTKQQLARVRKREALRDARRANALEVATQSVADDSWMIARTQ